jgi:hypothetical protein
MTDLNYKKGFFRIILVLSSICVAISIIFFIHYLYITNSKDFYKWNVNDDLGVGLFFIVIAVSLWVLFYVSLFIVEGFKKK